MITEIDTRHLGRDRVIAAHTVRGLIVDPGPASALGNWVDALETEPRGLVLTHIHLDHAGAAGVLVRRWPQLTVYVSEVGAPHLIDPSKLLASASRLYGPDNMERLWGEVAPVPEHNVVALAGGERVEGFDVLATPGHARHHLCFVDEHEGDAFVGDVAGVRVDENSPTVVPTPPPEIDVEAWLRSLDAVAAAGPQRLRLTHFGRIDDPAAQLERARENLVRSAELARSGREAFLGALEAELEQLEPESAARMRQATPPEQQWLGLERYLRKRAESESA